MFTRIVRTPSLLGRTWYFPPRSRHNAIVTRVLEYPWMGGPATQEEVPSRGMLYTGTETPSSRWASHPELTSESWLVRRGDRGAAM